MKSHVSLFLLFILLAVFPAFHADASQSTDADAPASVKSIACPSVNGALHVDGRQLTDEHGNAVQLKGISTHGLAWFPDYVNQKAFHQLRQEWNVNVIRLAMYTTESGGYCTDGDQGHLKSLIDQGVSYASSEDMYVIIDWHILSDQDPNQYKEQALAFFAEMSEKYADHNNVLYEICNEPNGSTTWNDVKSYAEQVIPVIRSNAPDAVILVGTPNWSQYVDQAAADPITDYDNLMYTLHFYAATHKEDLRNTLQTALDQGLPVFVSEYSICDASGNGALDIGQADAWMQLLDQYQVSCVNWSLCNKRESAALLNASCDKTCDFTVEDLSPAGRWLYEMLTSTDVPEPETEPLGSDPSAEKSQLSTNAYTCTTEIVNQWESNGDHYYQYQLTLTNTSDTELSGWEIDLPFSGNIALSDGWNGDYTIVDSQTLHIVSKDYNAVIAPGASVTDIGFILIYNF